MAKFKVIQGVSRGGYQLHVGTEYDTKDFTTAFMDMLKTEKIISYTSRPKTVGERIDYANGTQLGNRIALISDSIGQAPYYVGNAGGNDDTVRMRGETWIATASIASKGLIRVGINAAVAGNTTQQMLDRIDDDLGEYLEKWDTLTICGGVNDTAYTPKQTAANIEAMAIKAFQWGKNVIFCTAFPSGTHESRVRIRKINYFVNQLAAKYHAPLVDFHARFLDPATGSWKAGLNADSIHPNLAGINDAGKFFSSMITPLMQPAQPFLALDNLDTRVMINGSTFNPLWLIDTNADGVPDGFSASSLPAGITRDFAIESAFDADAKRFKLTSTGTVTGNHTISAAFSSTTWAVGDVCQVALKVRFAPGVPGTLAPKFFLRVKATGSVEGYGFQQELLASHDGVIVSEPFTIPEGTTAFSYEMGLGGGAAVADFARPTLINLTRQGML